MSEKNKIQEGKKTSNCYDYNYIMIIIIIKKKKFKSTTLTAIPYNKTYKYKKKIIMIKKCIALYNIIISFYDKKIEINKKHEKIISFLE